MFTRLRSTWMAGGGAMVLVLVVSGAVAAASVLTAVRAPVADPIEPPEVVVDTTRTFEDLDGDGVDDDCDDEVVEDAEAATAAVEAVDLNGDGVVSVSEAAQSDWTAGTNCNHGGYVSIVAHGQCDATEPVDETTEPADGDEEAVEACLEEPEDEDETAPEDEEAVEAECEDVAPPERDLEDTAPNAHGTWVSSVAQSDAVGGKNCNHGGAVSEAAKKDQEAAKEARDAAKAERDAERQAARDARAGKAKNGNQGKGR